MTATMEDLRAASQEEWRRGKRRPAEPWEPPDWAPDDAGGVLFRDGDWVTIRDYVLADHRPTSVVVHMCDGGPWVLRCNPPQLLSTGVCDACGAEAPPTVRGFNALVKWDR